MTPGFHGLLLSLQDHIREHSDKEMPSEKFIKNYKFVQSLCSLLDEQYFCELTNIRLVGNESSCTATENLTKWHQSDSRGNLVCDPSALLDNLIILNPGFVKGRHHDAQECFSVIISIIIELADMFVVKPFPLAAALFRGSQRVTVMCTICKKERTHDQNFEMFELDIPRKTKTDSWFARSSRRREKLTGSDKAYCGVCHSKTDSELLESCTSYPENVCLHLKIFKNDKKGVSTKILKKPFVPLYLPCLICDSTCAVIEHKRVLTAVIVHSGQGLSSGHYFSFLLAAGQEEFEASEGKNDFL